MERWFEIWETETGNLAGDYGSRDEALAVIRRILASDHPETVNSLFLTEERESGESIRIAAGSDLIRLAQRTSPVTARR